MTEQDGGESGTGAETAPLDAVALSDLGVALIQQGRLEEAVATLRQALAAQADSIPALVNLGVALRRLGQLAPAAATYAQALALAPGNAVLYVNLGNVLADLGQEEDAAATFRRALGLQPGLPAAEEGLRRLAEARLARAAALNGEGNAHFAAGRWAEAADCYRRALDQASGYADAHANLGNALRGLGRLVEAMAAYRRAIDLSPGNGGYWCNLGMAHQADGQPADAVAALRHAVTLDPTLAVAEANLAMALRAVGEEDAALDAGRRALALDPDMVDVYTALMGPLIDRGEVEEADDLAQAIIDRRPDSADAHVCLANVRQAQRRHAAAVTICRAALALKPDCVPARLCLAVALKDLARLAEALEACDRVLAVEPQSTDARNLRAAVHIIAGDLPAAVAAAQDALALKPDMVDAHVNLGIAHLLAGRLTPGWHHFDWRLHAGHKPKPWDVFPAPPWRGEDLGGRTLMVHAEQGMGDLIQFCRYVDRRHWPAGRAPARIVMTVPPPLARLFAGLEGLDRMIVGDDRFEAADAHAALLSLPGLLGTTLENVPAAIPYLAPPPDALAGWSALFADAPPGPRVGIVWAGNPEHKGDNFRSLGGIDTLAPLWRVPGVRWYSLQVGKRAGDAHYVRNGPPGGISNLSGRLGDYAETAGAIAQLDLVITVDTSVAHLAGAMGKPVWILVSATPDWRWMLGRADSPWYPTARLFRQSRLGDWRDPVDEVAQALAALVNSEPAPSSAS
ncbi:MAG: tetratricopeptide repeat protein [Azospirillaceae bacterium]|nr:tetratricopeptide repeat protein [Azospirillaceae bacterium]